MHRHRGAVSAILLVLGATSAARAAPTPTWSVYAIHDLFNSCLGLPNATLPRFVWGPTGKFIYQGFSPLTEAERLNGVTQKGLIEIDQTYRYPDDSPWRDGKFYFSYERANGVSAIGIMPLQMGEVRNAAWDLAPFGKPWPCHSRG